MVNSNHKSPPDGSSDATFATADIKDPRAAATNANQGVKFDGELENKDEQGQSKELQKEAERRKARKDRYMGLASKMRVDQMLEQIQIDAKLDFDYVAFLCAARCRSCMPSFVAASETQSHASVWVDSATRASA